MIDETILIERLKALKDKYQKAQQDATSDKGILVLGKIAKAYENTIALVEQLAKETADSSKKQRGKVQMIILCSIGFFLLGFFIGSCIVAMLSVSSKEEAVNDAFRMGYEMAKISYETIDVTELPGIGDN